MGEWRCRRARNLLSVGAISTHHWQSEACSITHHHQDKLAVQPPVNTSCLGRHFMQTPRQDPISEGVCSVGGIIFQQIIRDLNKVEKCTL